MDSNILISECIFKAARSSGKGGQHVNKVSTRMEVQVNIPQSEALSANEKNRLQQTIGNKLSSEGFLRMYCDQTRSQRKNKELLIKRLLLVLSDGLKENKPRVKTKVPKKAKRKRLTDKSKRKELKVNRRRPEW